MAAANDTGASRASRRHRTRDDAPPVSPSAVETASEASWRGEHEGGERRGSDGRASEEDDWSPRADDPLNSTRRKLEETFVSPDESERGSRRSRGSRKSRASDSSRRASSDHASAATEDFSQPETLPEEEEIGPGAPFPETMEEREARLLRKLNASMENNMRYWAKDAETVPVPEFPRDDLDPNAGVAYSTEDGVFMDIDDDDDLSVNADAGGSLSGDSGDRIGDVLGDFESARDLATPWNERPKVIARKMVRLIINRALREKFPPPEKTFWQGLCGCLEVEDAPRRRRRSRR